jgi:hypothetical protein
MMTTCPTCDSRGYVTHIERDPETAEIVGYASEVCPECGNLSDRLAVFDGRMAEHTAALDLLMAQAGLDIEPPTPTYDAWNAIRLQTGRPCGSWLEYMQHTDRNTLRYWPAMVMFGAVDDDDEVPSYEEVQS